MRPSPAPHSGATPPEPPRPRPPGQRPGHPAARRSRRWGMRLIGVVSGAVLATSGFGWAVVEHVNEGIDRVDAFHGIKERPKAEAGVNFLLVGVDRRDGLTPDERRRLHAGGSACDCTDTLMLLHVSKDRRRVSVVSLPRDSYVEFPLHNAPDDAKGAREAHPHGKINAAYALGGPALTVHTVERATGVHIDHYLEVNFLSFVRTVDALGGVKVCTMTPLHDAYSGLDLPSGSSVLDGATALRYVRARHIDSSSDFGRIERQQRFLAQVIGQLHSTGVLVNPARLTNVVDTLLTSVRADRDLSSQDLVTLGTAMRHFSPAGSEFTQVPVADADYRGDPAWGSSVLWDRRRAAALFARIRHDEPLARHRRHHHATPVPIDPHSIRVQIRNATGDPQLGLRADHDLARTGFATTGTPQAGSADPNEKNLPDKADEKTTITFDPRWDRSAQSLATALPGARLKPVKGHGPVLTVTVGRDFGPVRRVRAQTAGMTENPDGAVTGDQVICP
jgi:LCP family protein required for cell wall assembly